jgi:Flp pilus assembly protein TadG
VIGAVRAGRRRLLAERSGAVMIEFLMAFPPIFALFLGAAQLALLAAADLVVRHAAIAGVRSAVVVLDDDPRHYEGAPRRRLDGDGPRMAAIRSAVHAPLAAIAPDAALLARPGPSDVALALGGVAGRMATGLGGYLATATAVVFPNAAGSAELREDEPTADPVVLRVTYLVPCAVPVAGALLCRRLFWDTEAKRLVSHDEDEATRRALEDLKRAPGAAGQAALALRRLPMAIMTAEAALPLHAAPYAYAGEQAEP